MDMEDELAPSDQEPMESEDEGAKKQDDPSFLGGKPADDKKGERRRFFLRRLGSNLINEEVDIADAGVRSQLSRLNRLMKMDISDKRRRKRFVDQLTELIKANPKLASCRFRVEDYFEPLLHQVICKRPPLHLVELIYAYNPGAASEKGFEGYTLLHDALLCHNSKDVIEFLVKQEPSSLQARPFPPLFCATDHETDFEILELLVKKYPDALCSCDYAAVTPLDIALMEQLPLPIIQLFFSHYPGTELKITERAGCIPMLPEISSIFASDHHVIQTLDATNMRFTAEAWVSFFRVLATNSTLDQLIIDLGETEVDPDVCEALCTMIRENDSLRKLRISGRILPTAFAKAIVKGFKENNEITDLTFLVHLDLMNVESLIRHCQTHTSLKKLTLNHCVGSRMDWTGISSLTSLRLLDLSDCRIGSELAEPLVQLLELTENLEELLVARNWIGDDGTVQIAKALEHNASVKRLDYGQNGIEDLGWKAFIKTLQESNTTLVSLGFALDDPKYEIYSEQLLYYCDRNALGRSPTSSKKVVFVDQLSNEEKGPAASPLAVFSLEDNSVPRQA